MGFFPLFFACIFSSLAMAQPTQLWLEPWRTVPQLVRILREVPEGRDVLAKASKKSPDFWQKIRKGSASFTESTFSRTYSLLDGKEKVSLHHEITLNKNLSLADAVADLAHELVHFSEKGMLDPYRPGFDVAQFVRDGIEAEGGELAALEMECRVAWSLETAFSHFPKHKLCERYRGNRVGAFLRNEARRDYYALGSWFHSIDPTLKPKLPDLSAHAPVFTSSYAGKPYPVALVDEYAMTRRAACENNRRKYRLIASQVSGRGPAASSLWEERRRLRAYELRYCSSVPDKTEN